MEINFWRLLGEFINVAMGYKLYRNNVKFRRVYEAKDNTWGTQILNMPFDIKVYVGSAWGLWPESYGNSDKFV